MVNITTINISSIQNITSFYGAVSWVNTYSGGVFFTLFLAAIYIILIITLRSGGLAQAVTVSSLTCFVMALIFGSIGLVPFSLTVAFFVLLSLGAFYIFFSNNMSQS